VQTWQFIRYLSKRMSGEQRPAFPASRV